MAFPSIKQRSARAKAKPKSYSDTSVSTYYNEREGLDLLPTLESLSKSDRGVATFNSYKRGCKVGTLYINLADAWRWLIENHPEGEKWRTLRRRYEIKKEGPLVKFLPLLKVVSLTDAVELGTDEALPYADAVNWKKAVLDYLETAADGSKPLELRQIMLEEKDIDWLSLLLGKLDEKVAVLTLKPTHIRIVKNAALAKKLKEEGRVL